MHTCSACHASKIALVWDCSPTLPAHADATTQQINFHLYTGLIAEYKGAFVICVVTVPQAKNDLPWCKAPFKIITCISKDYKFQPFEISWL
jgi:hypothetical protein